MPGHKTLCVDSVVSSLSAATPYYPSDGRGSYGTSPSDAVATESTVTTLVALYSGNQSTGNTIHVYHGDGTLAYVFYLGTSSPGEYSAGLGPDGVRLEGQWYFEVTGTAAVRLNFCFDIES